MIIIIIALTNRTLHYNGHKRKHWLKFQSVVVPNGMIANLQGPYKGRKHDCSMLHETNLLNNLRQNAWANGEPLCLYGDPAFPLNPHIFRCLLKMPRLQLTWELTIKLWVRLEWQLNGFLETLQIFFNLLTLKNRWRLDWTQLVNFMLFVLF